MAVVSADERENLHPRAVQAGAGEPNQRQVLLGSSSFAVAAVEAICVFLVSANGLLSLVGGASIGLAQGAAFFHAAAIRLPLLALATFGALLNLWLLVNAGRLRRAASAQWRRKPLLPKERRRIFLVATMSVLTLLIVAAELFLHHKSHGSVFSRLSHPVPQMEPNGSSV